MNFFKAKTSWSNAELIVLKICIASAYVLLGAYFHSFVGGLLYAHLICVCSYLHLGGLFVDK